MVHVERPKRKGMRKSSNRVSTAHISKLGRHHKRHIQFKSAKTKNRMRIKVKDICANGKMYLRDLKKYHVLKLYKVHGTKYKLSSWLNYIKKNTEQLKNKEPGTYIYNCTGYFFKKRYHLN